MVVLPRQPIKYEDCAKEGDSTKKRFVEKIKKQGNRKV
jgi:hypothetical protein